jgi:hypothetical protein
MLGDPELPPPIGDESSKPGVPMPRWVPIVIGSVLLALALLAVYTGLTYRRNTLVRIVHPRRVRMSGDAGVPGEPQAGASRMYPGENGENVPIAHPPAQGSSRAIITGGPGGVHTTIRMWARRALRTEVEPPDALVYVNDIPIGEARQFMKTDEMYDFPAAGSYTIRLVAPGYRQKQFVVTATGAASQEVATIKAKLEKE